MFVCAIAGSVKASNTATQFEKVLNKTCIQLLLFIMAKIPKYLAVILIAIWACKAFFFIIIEAWRNEDITICHKKRNKTTQSFSVDYGGYRS
jgi:hypothetical protein